MISSKARPIDVMLVLDDKSLHQPQYFSICLIDKCLIRCMLITNLV